MIKSKIKAACSIEQALAALEIARLGQQTPDMRDQICYAPMNYTFEAFCYRCVTT